MRFENVSTPYKNHASDHMRIEINDLPEIAVLNREIDRFKKAMLQNPNKDEEDSYRAVAERNLLNGLERARDLLILSYVKSCLAANEC